MSIKDVLINEFIEETEKLDSMEVGTEEHKVALDGVTKLADRVIEIEKFEAELEEKKIQREEEKRERNNKFIIGLATSGVTLASYWLAFIMSTNFERFGTFTGKAGQGSAKELLSMKSKF